MFKNDEFGFLIFEAFFHLTNYKNHYKTKNYMTLLITKYKISIIKN